MLFLVTSILRLLGRVANFNEWSEDTFVCTYKRVLLSCFIVNDIFCAVAECLFKIMCIEIWIYVE